MDYDETRRRFAAATAMPDPDIDLSQAALLIAASEYPNLDIDGQLAALDSLANAASRRVEEAPDIFSGVNRLSEYLFDEVGFLRQPGRLLRPAQQLLERCALPAVSVSLSLCPWCAFWLGSV